MNMQFAASWNHERNLIDELETKYATFNGFRLNDSISIERHEHCGHTLMSIPAVIVSVQHLVHPERSAHKKKAHLKVESSICFCLRLFFSQTCIILHCITFEGN